MEKLYFTKRGYRATEQKIEEAEKSLAFLQSQTAYVAEVGGNQYHDNSSYELLIIDIRAADFKLKQLRDSLNKSLVVDTPASNNIVTIGTKVTCLVNGEKKTFTIVGHGESDPENNRIAYNSPLASLMLLSEEGEELSKKLSGKKFEVEILKIELDEEVTS